MTPQDLEAAVVQRWDFSDAAASRAAMTAAAEDVANDLAGRLIWQTQIARAAGLQGDFDDALDILGTVERQAEAVPEGRHRHHVLARLAIERGRVLNSSGDAGAAGPYFTTALDEARVAGTDGLAVDALHMTAIVVSELDGPDASRPWNEQALHLAETSAAPAAMRWRGSLLNNLGWDHHDAGRFEEALRCFERAVDVRREEPDTAAIHVAEWAVARALRSLRRYDEALARQRSLAATPEGKDDGYVHEEIGECLLALGREDEAASSFARAHALLSQDGWLVEHEPDRLTRLERLAAGS